MPDLTLESCWMCASNEHWEIKVQGSRGDEYTVTYGRSEDPDRQWDYDWSCSCPAFKFRHRRGGEFCKHIKAVQSQRCAWNSEQSAGLQPATGEDGEFKCPNCGGKVVGLQVAV